MSLTVATRRWLVLGGGALASTVAGAGFAKPPTGYPRSYEGLENQGNREGRLIVYSAADLNEVTELLKAFRARYPRIDLHYEHMASKEVFDRYVREVAAGK